MPPAVIIQNGLYAIWRHPIYLFYTLVFVGLALMIGLKSLLLIGLPAFSIIELCFIYLEEKILIRRHGESYLHYKYKTSLIIPELPQLLKVPFYVLFKLLFSYDVINKDKIPNQSPFFLIAAHRNYLDPFFIALPITYPVSYITTFEVFRNPVSRFLFTKLFCIPRRRYLKEADSVRKIIKSIHQTSVIGIFPEGKRSWTGTIGPFKPEAVKLLKKFRTIPILPVKIEGNYHAWPRWGKNIRRAKIRVIFQEPVHIEQRQTLEEVEQQIRELIKPQDEHSFCKSKNIVRHINMVIYRCPVCFSFKPVVTIGAATFKCLDCETVFSLLSDYKIQYHAGGSIATQSIDALYREIKITREDIFPQAKELIDRRNTRFEGGEQVIAQCNRSSLYSEKGDKLVKIFDCELLLTSRYLRFVDERDEIKIALDEITSVTIESNYKLQIYQTGDSCLFQIIFENESALKWQDYILETIKQEFNFLPNCQ